MISPELLAEVRPLASRFRDAGCGLYLVGGIVRDQVLGRALAPESDIDLTTDAHPAMIKKLVGAIAEAVWTQGERFGTIGCLIQGRAFEITTHRGESYDPGSRKPEVVFAAAVEQDLARRDFTVNAMAVSLPDGALVDPFGGRRDLAAGLLRTPLEPELSFSDDPLRMLRAARFVSGYGLTPDPALLTAIDQLAPRMAIVSVERRRDELDKLLVVGDPSAGLRLVVEHGLAPYVLPALAEAEDPVVRRAIAAVEHLPAEREVRLAALVAPEDLPTDSVVRKRLRDLRYSNGVVASVASIVAGASVIWSSPHDWSDERVRRLAAAAGSNLPKALGLASTRVDTAEPERAIAALSSREDLDDLAPALDGEDVMSLLGIAPGAAVGEALAYLREIRITEGVLVRGDAEARLAGWWQKRAGTS